MIPIIETYLKDLIQNGLKDLKKHAGGIEMIFRIPGKNASLAALKAFILSHEIQVRNAPPTELQDMPCFVITLLEESEISNSFDLIKSSSQHEMGGGYLKKPLLFIADMQNKYQITCWSGDADMSGFMYAMLKWLFLCVRKKLQEDGLKLPKISGKTLEPDSHQLPITCYRRALNLTFNFENLFFGSDSSIGTGKWKFPKDWNLSDFTLIRSKGSEEENVSNPASKGL